jgi:DNA-binding GntR family transcriptional regulator
MRRGGLAPIVKRSAEDLALDSLRSHILSGGLPGGARVTEHGLADSLAISRATLRTALHRLAAEGLVVQTPYIGWQVLEFTPDDIWELYTLRASLDALAARLLAERMDMVRQARLRRAFDALALHCRNAELHGMAESDFALHKLIVDLAGHGRLASQYRLVEQQIRFFVTSSDALVTDPVEVLRQHEALVRALLAGEAGAAGLAAEQHCMVEGRKLHAFTLERARQQGRKGI